MRVLTILSVLLVALCLALPALAWEQTDYEIFELQEALEASEGKGTTFYSILNLTSKATASDIKKMYRKRSVELHPDKLPNDPGAHKRFERLGLINKILRDHRKDRYDHFLSTGFPKWRGTGYYYQRFRPGLFSVLLIILGISVGVELLIKRVQFEQAKKRVAGLRKWSFYSAYGPRFWEVVYKRENGPKVPSEKKVKVSLGSVVDLPSPASSSSSSKEQGQLPAAGFDWEALEREVKRSAQQSTPSGGPSGTVEVLVTLEDDGEAIVWITDAETGEWVEVDENKLPKPTLKECWPVRVAHKIRGKRGAEIVLEQEGETAPTDASGAATAAAATTSATKTASANGNGKQRKNKKR